mgnify:CR=1 FL=1
MSFVKHKIEEVNLGECIYSTSCAFVRGDDNVDLAMHRLLDHVSVLREECAFYLLLPKELMDLLVPLESEGIRTDHKTHWPGSFLHPRFINNNGQTLNSFPKSHFITQAAIKAVLAQLAHPLNPLLLILSKLCVGNHGQRQIII